MVGTHLGTNNKRRRNTSLDMKCVMQYKEGEEVKCKVMDIRDTIVWYLPA